MKKMLAIMFFCLLSVGVMAKSFTIVTSTTDLADLAKAVAGDRAEVVSLSRGNQDPHAVEPRPSMVIKLKQAELVIRIGMDLDAWMTSLIETARNPKLIVGGQRVLDASEGVEKLEIPQGKIDGSMGDIHLYGNPHYWLDPENGRIMLKHIYMRLTQLSPENAPYFKVRYIAYDKQLAEAIVRWKAALAPYAGTSVVTYHKSLPYFAKAFQLEVIGQIEYKPGIPPTPVHLINLSKTMLSRKAKVIMMEPWQNERVAKKLSQETQSSVLVFAPSVGAIAGVESYIGLFDYNVGKLLQSLK